MANLTKSSRELSNSEKILLGSVTVLAVAFIFWVFILNPSLEKIKPLETEVAEYKNQLGNVAALESEISQMEKQLVDLKVEYEEATKVIPKTDRYPELIKELREMATQAGLKIENETLARPVVFIPKTEDSQQQSDPNATENSNTQEGLQIIKIGIDVSGDFNKALDYIKKLESDKRILMVDKISSDNKKTSLGLTYYISGVIEKEEYDFNNGSYGKDNIFN